MPEAHQPLASLQCLPNVVLGVPILVDVAQHVEHRSGRAAVKRPLQGPNRGGDRGDEVRLGRDDGPGCEGLSWTMLRPHVFM